MNYSFCNFINAFALFISIAVTMIACDDEPECLYYQMGIWGAEIRDGNGDKAPLNSNKNYYELFIECLYHKEGLARWSAARDLSDSVFMGGTVYPRMLDAFIAKKKSTWLMNELYKAREDEINQDEDTKQAIAYSIANLKIKLLLYEHPYMVHPIRKRSYLQIEYDLDYEDIRNMYSVSLFADYYALVLLKHTPKSEYAKTLTILKDSCLLMPGYEELLQKMPDMSYKCKTEIQEFFDYFSDYTKKQKKRKQP